MAPIHGFLAISPKLWSSAAALMESGRATQDTGRSIARRHQSGNVLVPALADDNAPPNTLAAELDWVLDGLAAHRVFLHRIHADGGRSEFFVGWYLRSQVGETFSHSMLAKIADLRIDLALDIYHDPQLRDDDQ